MKYAILFFAIWISFVSAGFSKDSAPPSFSGKAESFSEAHRVMQKSCLPCHSTQFSVPWYGRLPIMRSMLKHEFRSALSGMNFDQEIYSPERPLSEATLNKIEKSILDGTMPPFDYRFRKWGGALSKKEKKAILNWIEDERFFLTPEISERVIAPEPALEAPVDSTENRDESKTASNPFKPKKF